MLRLKAIAESSLNRVKLDKDLAIAITAPEGDGKSALSIGLGMEIDPKYFSLERNVLFSPNVGEIRKKIYNLPRFTPIIADEAIKIMYKLNWGTKIQKYLNQIYAVCRNQNKISIFNMPRFTDFSEYFRNHRIKLWIHIVDPINNQKEFGHAVLMSRSWNPITSDPWGLKIFEKAIELERKRKRKDAEYDLNSKIDLFSQLPSFVDVLEFGWVKQSAWDSYLELKNQIGQEDEDLFNEEKFEKQLTDLKKVAVIAIKTFKAMDYKPKDIAALLQIHPNTMASWLKEKKKQKEVSDFKLQ